MFRGCLEHAAALAFDQCVSSVPAHVVVVTAGSHEAINLGFFRLGGLILRSSNEVLTQKGVDMNKIREIWTDIPFFSKEIDEQVEINAHYRGYLKKQKADILAFKRDENLIIPDKINYDSLSGLSNEVKAKFKEIKPKTMRVARLSYRFGK